ncbi:MAG: phosphoribosyltransferase [Epsilonproteobacteria bacterium]|nr:phosphoribosyltransferase [Campylobacterota bacterium]
MERYYYGYDEFIGDTKRLFELTKEYNPDTLLAISRGGVTLGHFLAIAMDNRRLFTLNSIHYEDSKKLDTLKIFNIPSLEDAKRVLVIDDIIDSGETMREIISILKRRYPDVEFRVVTLFYKPTASFKADYSLKEATKWIDFFWEVDINRVSLSSRS